MKNAFKSFGSKNATIKITNLLIVFIMVISLGVNGIGCDSKSSENKKVASEKLQFEQKGNEKEQEKLAEEKLEKKQAAEQQRKEQEKKAKKVQEDKAKIEYGQANKTNNATTSSNNTIKKEIPQSNTDNQSVAVYSTDTGKKYHSNGCQYLRKSKIAINLKDAKLQGLTPCSKCHPPR
ncbi:hypothetical protein SAMN02745163_00947 [Clostridium cavendishii DSM 21758]|uniref:Uncharacterized protein n=1 Tax=Clostridium cavendishii DSM 21758 TaxID=1121302 RepID=A0A1M6EU91_9CLOT|nr:hypothetical protein [Clostridium cavendishii]SHI89051.1 hypothetical protein SAMN02745163_00947 [Clostridium cavendishii DSM 21758]